MIRLAALCVLLACPAAAQVALELPLGSIETANITEDPGRYDLPTGRYSIDHQPSQGLEGRIVTRVWRVPATPADTLTLLRLIRPQLKDAGYETVFECDTNGCGGFDFRFNTPVLPPPKMEFDLADFRFLSARRDAETPAYISVLISKSGRGVFVQAIDVIVRPPRDVALSLPAAPSVPDTSPTSADEVLGQLGTTGRLILSGMQFPSGAQTLDKAAIDSLAPLARAMRQAPELRIVLVGHTDNAGSLAANIALSRSRAQAVRNALINLYGIEPERIDAEGAGYLAPLLPNTSDENRATNRRVEAILR